MFIFRALFGRRNSLTIRRQSRESSTEHLEERSSAGSTDDLDSVGSHTPKHFSKLVSALGSRVNQVSNEMWGRVGLRKLDSDSSLRKSSTDSLLECHSETDVRTKQPCSDVVKTVPNLNSIKGESVEKMKDQEQRKLSDNNDCETPPSCKSPTLLSQKTSPIRTPVTENDPLGALDMQDEDDVDCTVITDEAQDQNDSSSVSTLVSGNFSVATEAAGGPVLFGGCGRTRGVSRSATFTLNGSQMECDLPSDDSEASQQTKGQKAMQRSSTMPVDVPVTTSNSVVAGLSSLGSSFKLPFR